MEKKLSTGWKKKGPCFKFFFQPTSCRHTEFSHKYLISPSATGINLATSFPYTAGKYICHIPYFVSEKKTGPEHQELVQAHTLMTPISLEKT